MKTWILFLAWLAPFGAVVVYFSARLLAATSYMGGIVSSMAIGTVFGLATLFVFIFLLLLHPAGRFVASVLLGVLAILPIPVVASSGFTSFVFLFIIGIYTLGWAIFNAIDVVMSWKRSRKLISGLQKGSKHAIASALMVSGFLFTCVACVLSPGYVPMQSIDYEITDGQADSYELVLYWPAKDQVNDSFCALLQAANVTTNSFSMLQDEFENGTIAEMLATNATRAANARGLKVEIWPLFNAGEGHYPSISEIDRFPELYEAFHNWTLRNNITVDYILWDIESEGEGTNASAFINWIEPFKTLATYGAMGRYISSLRPGWVLANEAIRNLAARSRTDGHIARATTSPIIWDVFDGDGQLQMLSGIPAWDSSDAYEYISMMSYRGCGWGGNTSASWIYEHVRASRLTQPGKVAICLGCLNYNPYGKIASVVNDVRLALAAGANAVRLFQGWSWVAGVSPNPDQGVLGNPANGYNGTTGLLQLLQACRSGGTVTYKPEAAIYIDIFVNILVDVAMDLVNPF